MKIVFYTVITTVPEIKSAVNTIDSISANSGTLDISHFLIFNGIKSSLSLPDHCHSLYINSSLSLLKAIYLFRNNIRKLSFTHVCRVDPGDTINSFFCASFKEKSSYEISIPCYEMVDKSYKTLSTLRSSEVCLSSQNQLLSEFHGAGTIFLRSVFFSLPSLPPNLTRQDGYFFWLNTLDKSFCFLENSTYYYVKDDNSLSSSTSSIISSRYSILKYIWNSYNQIPKKIALVCLCPSVESVEYYILSTKTPFAFSKTLLDDFNSVDVTLFLICPFSDKAAFQKIPFESSSQVNLCFVDFSSKSVNQILSNAFNVSSYHYIVYLNPRYPFCTLQEAAVCTMQTILCHADCGVLVRQSEHLTSQGHTTSLKLLREHRLYQIQNKRQSGAICLSTSSISNRDILLCDPLTVSVGSSLGGIYIPNISTFSSLSDYFTVP